MRGPGRPLRAGFVLGLLALGLAGCDLFKPAVPEIGATGTTLIASYSDTGECLKYMALGIERKDAAGQTAYLGAMADTSSDGVGFHAFFDAAVWNAYTPTKPSDWDLDHETQFYASFITLRSEAYNMEWGPDEDHPLDQEVNTDTLLLHRHYAVWALASPDSILIAVGYADLYFARISASRWALIRWMDRVDPDIGVNPKNELWRTFGYLRLNASTGG